jgi:hypothetical protein
MSMDEYASVRDWVSLYEVGDSEELGELVIGCVCL